MQLVFDFPIHPHYSFDNFVVCSGNRTAWDFARLLTAEGEIHNLLYIYGDEGCGKTHLLTAIGTAIGGGDPVPCLSCREIADIYGGRYPDEGPSRLQEHFGSSPVLLVDDIDLLPDETSVRVELWDLFNDFYQRGGKIAVTGTVPPRELRNIDDHLASRLLWGLVARIDVSDDESRSLVLRKLAADRQVVLPDEVIAYLLQHGRRDIPSLVASLDTLQRLALAEKRKITIRLAREAFAEAS